MSETKRVKWLDCTKGLAAILVVAGHIASGYLDAGIYSDYTVFMTVLYNVIYSFHMPLFFLLSGFAFGYAYTDKESGQLRSQQVKQQIGNLIVLYFAWCVILWCFKYIFSAYVNTEHSVYSLLWLPLRAISPFWYLYILVLCYLATHFLKANKIAPRYIFLFSALLCLAQYWIVKAGNITAIGIVSYYFFFYLGSYLSQRETYVEKASRLPTLLFNLLIGCALGIWFFFTASERINWGSIPVLGSIVAVTLSLSLIGFLYRYHLPVLDLIGKYALEIYLLHVFITAGNRKILPMIGIDLFGINFVVNLLMATFIPILLGMLLKKWKLHAILFRPFSHLSR